MEVSPKMANMRLPICPKMIPITDERMQEINGMTTNSIKRLFLGRGTEEAMMDYFPFLLFSD